MQMCGQARTFTLHPDSLEMSLLRSLHLLKNLNSARWVLTELTNIIHWITGHYKVSLCPLYEEHMHTGEMPVMPVTD